MSRPVALRIGALLLLLASFIVIPALVGPIDRVAHDAGAEHVPRAYLFSRAISDGVLYPRWVQSLTLGLGDPLFTFNAPLPYYALDLFYRLGIPHPLGWRLLVALGLVGGLVGAFLLGWELTRRLPPALVTGVAFVYAPYVNENFFDRGSNEAIGMVLFPWVLWGLIRLARRPGAGRLVTAALLWGGCIASHVLAPLMLAPVAGLLGLVLAWRHRNAAPLVALLAGGLLTAAVWAPILDEITFTRIPEIAAIPEAIPADHPITLDRLLAPPAIYDLASGTNGQHGRVGLIHAASLLVAPLVALSVWRRGERALAAYTLGALGVGALIFVMLTDAGSPLWRAFEPALGILEYRTRLLSLLAVPTALLTGLLVYLLPARWRAGGASLLILLLIGTAIPSLYPELLHPHATVELPLTPASVREAEIEMDGSAFTAFGETHPRWLEIPLDRTLAERVAASPLAAAPPDVTLLDAEIRESAQRLRLRVDAPSPVTLHLAYYPRWRATFNDEPVPIGPEPGTGLARVTLPSGEGALVLDFATTPVERVALSVSALTLLLLVAAALRSWRRERTVAPTRPALRPAAPPLWLLGALGVIVVIKFAVIDPNTAWFRCRSTPEAPCNGAIPASVEMIAAPDLAGYRIAAERVAAGETLRLLVTWEGDEEQRDGLWSFVHLRPSEPGWPVNPVTGSDIWAQSENQVPADRPTGRYLPRKRYDDRFEVEIPRETPPGRYLVEIGWYDPTTGEQAEVDATTLDPPLRELWRSVVIGEVTVGATGEGTP